MLDLSKFIWGLAFLRYWSSGRNLRGNGGAYFQRKTTAMARPPSLSRVNCRALLILSLVAAGFVALNHISGVLDVEGMIVIEPVTKSSYHNITMRQRTNIIMFLFGHSLTHVLLVVMFWVRGRWTETMVLGDLRIGRVRPHNMSTAAFCAHLQSLYRDQFRKVCKVVYNGKSKNRFEKYSSLSSMASNFMT